MMSHKEPIIHFEGKDTPASDWLQLIARRARNEPDRAGRMPEQEVTMPTITQEPDADALEPESKLSEDLQEDADAALREANDSVEEAIRVLQGLCDNLQEDADDERRDAADALEDQGVEKINALITSLLDTYEKLGANK